MEEDDDSCLDEGPNSWWKEGGNRINPRVNKTGRFSNGHWTAFTWENYLNLRKIDWNV